MKKCLLALLLLLVAIEASAHSYYTNEPAGSRFIAECPLDPTVCNAVQGFVQIGRWYNLYQNGTCGAAPVVVPLRMMLGLGL